MLKYPNPTSAIPEQMLTSEKAFIRLLFMNRQKNGAENSNEKAIACLHFKGSEKL